MLLLITTLAFTGCSDKNETDVQSNNNTNNVENTTSNQYNVSGYWKVDSKEVSTGYYIVEFKDDNTMIEYFPNNNTLKSTYEIKEASTNNLTILNSSSTLIKLQKIDDFNMNILYDTVTEHATKISKADFNKLLNNLSESKDDTVIYNSYYQKYDENYTNIEENEISVEENYTNIEQNNISVEENNTSIEENNINIEDNDMSIEQTEINVEDNDTSIEQTEIDVEDNDAYIEETDIDIQDNDAYIEETEVNVEDNDAYIEENNISVEEENNDFE